ncbi:hypothetical protein O6H91_20G021000 [Diphasiastrum complanatum]|uniref:Uncharacterized protein n=1 Tax=Diphasiastrum complanatum TaxID=34168 RepID=A0ACC2ANC3_DIPCM|nr:hypothetical protein O6H91_20G021000 [Diphasiastrum complanatum]
MEADDAGHTEAGDGMHSLEECGSLMETDIANLNPLADHHEGQAFTHPLSNVSGQGSGSVGEGSETTLEIRIKTLDSSTYTVRVEKDISVPALKQQLVSVVGVAAENQRLICRGRVLKDDRLLSSYNVEDGHTLHMVARHLPQPSSTGSDGHGFQGPLDGSATSPESRPAQVTHSVLVGTINVPDVGEGGVPDLNRIISAVLNSVGSGNATFGSSNAPFENISGIGDTAGIPFVQAHTSAEGQARVLTGNARQQAGVGSHRLSPEPPSLRHLEVSPDSLTTMSLYLNRMEQALLASGYGGDEMIRTLSGTSQPQSSSHSPSVDRQDPNETVRLPTSRESLTPAALGLLVRRVNGLLRTQAGGVLSSLSLSLENEATLVDGAARVEVQSAAAWSGNILQQLGALLLELGRTTLTLHMGHSPADAVVNSGPALFISSVGPNPMMVQPPPLLPATVPLGAFSSGSAQPSGPGSPWPGSGLGPRSVNIHIHTSDLGGFLSSASDGSPPNNQQNSTGATATDTSSTLEQHLEAANRVSNVDVGERAPAPQDNDRAASSSGAQAGNTEPILQLSPVQGAIMIMQENGAMRMLPMRTRSAGVGVRPTTTTTTTEGAGTSGMLFHPLIPRFQQPSSPFHISQSIRPSSLGAFQQFQSNDPLSRATNSRPTLPPAIIQLSRISQALQPAVQSRGQLQNLTPVVHGNEWLSQASEGDVELALETLPTPVFNTSLSLQQQNNINTADQIRISSGGPNVVQGQTSASTAINVWEQPNVGATDTAVGVPETSRAELCNNTNRSNSEGDINATCEQDSTLSNAMEVEQGDQLPEELHELGETDIPCSYTEEAKRDSTDRGFSVFENDAKSGGTERSWESATIQKSADKLHRGLPTTDSLVIERGLRSGISTVNQVISKADVGNLFSNLGGSNGGLTDGGSGGSFNLITRSPALENYLETTTHTPEANNMESPTPSDHVLNCSNMTPAVHQALPDGDTLVIEGDIQPGSRMNNRVISSSNVGNIFSVLDRNNGILTDGGSGVSNNLILTRSPVLENFFHTTTQRGEANNVENFVPSNQGLNSSNIRSGMHQASFDRQLKPSLLSRVDVQPFSTMKENSDQRDLIERWNLFPGQGSNTTRGTTSAEPAQNDLASLLTLSSDVNQEIFDPATQQKEDKCEGKYCLKVPDRNGQTRVHRLSDFDECESSLAKKQKVCILKDLVIRVWREEFYLFLCFS